VNRYDGLNRRIVRDETGGGVGGELKHFYYNQRWQVLVEANSSNEATAMYSYHPHYVDAVAVRMRDADAHVYLQDANFNVTAVVDDAGSVVERYSYTPYGEVIFLDSSFAPRSSSLLSNEILYTGRRRDPETGLQINRNRFYAAGLGRWVNRDPIGYDGSEWNLYEYVSSNPAGFRDAQGLSVASCLLQHVAGPGAMPGMSEYCIRSATICAVAPGPSNPGCWTAAACALAAGIDCIARNTHCEKSCSTTTCWVTRTEVDYLGPGAIPRCWCLYTCGGRRLGRFWRITPIGPGICDPQTSCELSFTVTTTTTKCTIDWW
jgi:RHS repeat-associated protein